MVLKFLNHRIDLIARIRNMSHQDIKDKITENGHKGNYVPLSRWASGENSPRSDEQIARLSEALGVPIGFFYYKNVDITMDTKMVVSVYIWETGEMYKFNFENGNKIYS